MVMCAINYRPISLTCVACKLMERIIARHISDHLVNCNLLTAAQHGFVRSRSTCINLLESVNDWTLVIQNRSAVKIAYIDFTRAFDNVQHGISLQWSDEVRYLGIHIIRSFRFKISLDKPKRSFYRVANSIFGKVGRVASEEVTLQLFNSKCLPCTALWS